MRTTQYRGISHGDVRARLLANVTVEPEGRGCWQWTGTTSNGYGVVRWCGKKNTYAHRLSAEHLAGLDVAGRVVMHACDNPRCINPDHLRVGTQADNIADKVAKGRQPCGERAGGSRLTADDVAAIRQRAAAGSSQRSLAREYGVSPQHVSDIVRGKCWSHLDVNDLAEALTIVAARKAAREENS